MHEVAYIGHYEIDQVQLQYQTNLYMLYGTENSETRTQNTLDNISFPIFVAQKVR